MIVLDASIALYLVLQLPPHTEAIVRRVRDVSTLVAPHLIDAEITQVIRRYLLRGEISSETARQAVGRLGNLRIMRFPHMPLLDRVLDLAPNVTVYDGLYLALAEALNAPLITRDNSLDGIPGSNAAVEVVGGY